MSIFDHDPSCGEPLRDWCERHRISSEAEDEILDIICQAIHNEKARELGYLGGRKGGLATAAKMTPEQRTNRARSAAQARWAKR